MTAAQLPLAAAQPAGERPFTSAEIDALTRLQAGPVVIDTQSTYGRRFRAAVRDLRGRGFLVASSSGGCGYELTTDPVKLAATELDLRRKALAILRVYSAFRRSRQRIAA